MKYFAWPGISLPAVMATGNKPTEFKVALSVSIFSERCSSRFYLSVSPLASCSVYPFPVTPCVCVSAAHVCMHVKCSSGLEHTLIKVYQHFYVCECVSALVCVCVCVSQTYSETICPFYFFSRFSCPWLVPKHIFGLCPIRLSGTFPSKAARLPHCALRAPRRLIIFYAYTRHRIVR